MRTFTTAADVSAAVGEHLGYSRWRAITQDEIDQFAELTHDRQWIHVDPDRAARGPFGTTIVHGFFTLALVPAFSAEILRFEGLVMAINYGLDHTRFITPVRVGARLRSGAELLAATGDQTQRVSIRHTIEIKDQAKPASVIDAVLLLHW